jgi:hypothetical protein
VHIRDLDIPI